MNGMTQPSGTPKTPSDTAPAQAQPGAEGGGQEQKELDVKKLTAALITALEHKLGRRPTVEELAGALQDKEDPAADAEAQEAEQSAAMPKIFSYRIHYGLKENPDGSKEPDPETPLFYSNEAGDNWFDVDQGMWLDSKPPLADHLHNRMLGDSDSQKDVFDAIVYGVLDDEDYSLLAGQQGMLDPRCVRAYELHKKARDQYEQIQSMEKSVVPFEEEQQLTSGMAVAQPSNIDAMLQSAGLEHSKPEVQMPVNEPGAGGAQVMSEAALAAGIEPRIRRWIAEEIEKAVPQIVEYLLQLFGGEAVEPQGEQSFAEQREKSEVQSGEQPPIMG